MTPAQSLADSWRERPGQSALAWPQNPFDTAAEKGPSTFDVTHVFSASVIQDPGCGNTRLYWMYSAEKSHRRVAVAEHLHVRTTGQPFSIYSGVQQTGVGSIGADRPIK